MGPRAGQSLGGYRAAQQGGGCDQPGPSAQTRVSRALPPLRAQAVFTRGHTIESLPCFTDLVAEAGHEIGLHGYAHDNPLAMTPEQEEAIFDRSIAPNRDSSVNPRHLEELWRDHFDFIHREYDYAVVPMTIHPDVSGRPQVLMMLERLISHMLRQPGVRFVTLEEMAADFRRRVPKPAA